MKRRIAFVQMFSDQAWLGGKNYLKSLMSAVNAVARDRVSLVLITGHEVQAGLPQELPFLDIVRTPMLDRYHPAWIARQCLRGSFRRQYDPLFERLLRHLGIDVLSHSEPMVAPNTRIKTLGWLPDFQFMHLPQFWTPKQIASIQQSYQTIAKRSNAIILSSQQALQDLQAFVPRNSTPSHVLRFIPARMNFEALPSLETLRQKYELPQTYFHLPNQFWAHKNHGVVLEALAILEAQGTPVTVVCTGHTQDTRRPEYFESLMQRRGELKLESRFRVLGVVPYADMQSLMWHSHAVLNPSKFEGWSTTVEEAKALGKRIVLSDLGVHREQDPEHGYYFPVDDAPALAAAMQQASMAPETGWNQDEVERRYNERLHSFGNQYLKIVDSLWP